MKTITIFLAATLFFSLSFAQESKHPIDGWWSSKTCTFNSDLDEDLQNCRVGFLIMDNGSGNFMINFNNKSGGYGHSLNFEVKDGNVFGSASGTLTTDTLEIRFGAAAEKSYFKLTKTSENTATIEWHEAEFVIEIGDVYYINAELKK